jgi:hypothetical protein
MQMFRELNLAEIESVAGGITIIQFPQPIVWFPPPWPPLPDPSPWEE